MRGKISLAQYGGMYESNSHNSITITSLLDIFVLILVYISAKYVWNELYVIINLLAGVDLAVKHVCTCFYVYK